MRRFVVVALLVAAVAPAARAADCTRTGVGFTPLNDLGAGTYNGEQGGLYPGGANERPAAHEARGLAAASQVVPRTAVGIPVPPLPTPPVLPGWIVLLTIGMSNTNAESAQLVQLANADAQRNPAVKVVNRAQGGQDAERIKDPTSSYWSYVDQQLTANGVTAFQVQAVWLKEAIAGETFPAGPFLSWGPYLWADGLNPRSDGLTWACDELRDGGTHPSEKGARKVAQMILDFLHTDSTAAPWYLRSA